MLQVKTKLAQSRIQGLGLFADEFIAKGTLVQRFIPNIDIEISSEVISFLSDLERETLKHFCYKHMERGSYILCADNARFLNHSETPNLIDGGSVEEVDIAARDIEKGEELTVNYFLFDAEAILKLGKRQDSTASHTPSKP